MKKQIISGRKNSKIILLVLIILMELPLIIYFIFHLPNSLQLLIFFVLVLTFQVFNEVKLFEVYIKQNKIYVENIFIFKKYVFCRSDFLKFEKQKYIGSIYGMVFKDGQKFRFTNAAKGIIILPFDFSSEKDEDMIFWEKCINEMED